MTETQEKPDNQTKDIKLYSARSITLATFIGGPMASGYLIGENFKALGKIDQARKSLIIGIGITIILVVGLFMMPEKMVDKIPRQILPLLYTAAVWWIVEKTQGETLKSHEKNENSFFSGWRAAGIGLLAALILVAGIFAYVYFDSNNPAYEIYDTKISQFSKNETEALTFYDNIESKSDAKLLVEIDNIVLPKWEANVEIINNLSEVEDLPSDLVVRNDLLLEYSQLRLEIFTLIRKSIFEKSSKYDEELEELNAKLENVLDELN